MENRYMSDYHIGIIDIGTVSTRLFIAKEVDGRIHTILRQSEITDLGQGRSVSSYLISEAIHRTLSQVKEYVEILKEYHLDSVVCTLTSAARDADNIDELLNPLLELNLQPEVITGDVEARLSFLGVSSDFPDERILVLDIGGGSTEVSIGKFSTEDELEPYDLEYVRSFDVGCKRVTELFFKNDPPTEEELDAARAWAHDEFGTSLEDLDRVNRLVAVGGSATSLVSVLKKLEPYDAKEVHLAHMQGGQVSDLLEELSSLPLHERERLQGLQAKRAPVIVGGALILELFMGMGGFSELVVSESDMLMGIAKYETLKLEGKELPFNWEVRSSSAFNV